MHSVRPKVPNVTADQRPIVKVVEGKPGDLVLTRLGPFGQIAAWLRIKITTTASGTAVCSRSTICDELLIEALLRAHERGVDLRILVEGCPRTPEVNGPAIQRF